MNAQLPIPAARSVLTQLVAIVASAWRALKVDLMTLPAARWLVLLEVSQ